MKITCKYCGNKTYVERIEGRDACAYCGAGIKEDVVEDVVGRKKTYEEIMAGNLASAVKATTGILLKSSKKAIEQKKIPSVVDNDKSYQRTKTYKKSWGGFNTSRMGAMLIVIIVCVTMFAQPSNMWAVVDDDDISFIDREPILTEIGIRIQLINVSNGDILDSAGMVEIHNLSGENGGQLIGFEYYNEAMVLFSGLLEIGKAYEMWYYPNIGSYDFVYKTSFFCLSDEVYSFTFGF